MQAIERIDNGTMSTKAIQARLRAFKDSGGEYTRIERETGLSRSSISMLANHGTPVRGDKMNQLAAWLNVNFPEDEQAAMDSAAAQEPVLVEAEKEVEAKDQKREAYHTAISLYPSKDFREMMAWCALTREERDVNTITGEPGMGKTTVLTEFAKQTPGVHYIDCWSSMKLGDLVNTIADTLGITCKGTIHTRIMTILRHLQSNDDIMLLFDEAENLANWSVKTLDTLRKLWDNSDTPMIFAGTGDLESILIRGNGRQNCAYLYSRISKCKPTGLQEAEVVDILSYYFIEPAAKRSLVKLAMDKKHGGMRNFFFVLKKCLRLADGGQIDARIVKSVMDRKLLW